MIIKRFNGFVVSQRLEKQKNSRFLILQKKINFSIR
jgi:hypothetical protein